MTTTRTIRSKPRSKRRNRSPTDQTDPRQQVIGGPSMLLRRRSNIRIEWRSYTTLWTVTWKSSGSGEVKYLNGSAFKGVIDVPNNRQAAGEPMTELTALEQVAVRTLNDSSTMASQFYELASRVESAIATAEQVAADARTTAFDPERSPDPSAALAAMTGADFEAKRISVLLPRLQIAADRRRVVEEHDRWVRDYETLSEKVKTAAIRYREYPELARRLVDLVAEDAALTKQISELNSRCPAGEPRRLRTPEMIARNLTEFPTHKPSIATGLVVPSFERSADNLWPPPQQYIDPVLFAPAPYDPRYSAEWHTVAAEQQRQKLEREKKEMEEQELGRRRFYGEIADAAE
jgi:hypothetical protein